MVSYALPDLVDSIRIANSILALWHSGTTIVCVDSFRIEYFVLCLLSLFKLLLLRLGLGLLVMIDDVLAPILKHTLNKCSFLARNYTLICLLLVDGVATLPSLDRPPMQSPV